MQEEKKSYILLGEVSDIMSRHTDLKSAPIVIDKEHLRHIARKHGKELKLLGLSPLDYVQLIVDKYNEIREGNGESILLVIAREKGINDLAVVDLEYVKTNKSDYWMVKSAYPIRTSELRKKKLLW